MQPPQLLYHSDSPALFPTNTQSSLVTVRFPTPVRITSIRITPEGVASPTGSGTTYPAQWTGEVFLNSSDANPVNALERREVVFEGGEWPVEYDVGMPEDVTTRLISLLAPVESITLSIYGYHAAGPSTPTPILPQMAIPAKEDWGWVSAWAGGVSELLGMLGSKAEAEARERAVECLELLEDGQGGVIPQLLGRRPALSYILNDTSRPTLADLIFDNPRYALHPNVKSSIRAAHPLYALVVAGDCQRKTAWQHLDVGLSLYVLAQGKGVDLMDIAEGETQSNLSRLLDMAEGYASREDRAAQLELVLDIFDGQQDDPMVLAHLAGVVPRLTVISNIRNKADRRLSIPTSYAPIVTRSLLLCSSQVVGTTSAFPTAQKLVQPYLLHLPLDSPYHLAFSSAQALPPIPDPLTADSRRLTRLLTSLASPSSSSLVHTATPAELVNVLAPALYALLSTAPIPLLDIPSALANPTPESQASAWAGKVYSSNEFREREEARVGLGIKGARTGQAAMPSGQAVGLNTGEGLQPGPARMSRPASRHVDDFGR